jgi:hypothetical protein
MRFFKLQLFRILIVKMAGIVGLTCLKGKTPEKCLDIILDR